MMRCGDLFSRQGPISCSFLCLGFFRKIPSRLSNAVIKHYCPLDTQTRLLATVSRMSVRPSSWMWDGFVMIAHGCLARSSVLERMPVRVRKQSKTV